MLGFRRFQGEQEFVSSLGTWILAGGCQESDHYMMLQLL